MADRKESGTIRVILAVFGLKEELEIEALAMELDDLPLPYKFDVTAFENLRNGALRLHIEKTGLTLFVNTPITSS